MLPKDFKFTSFTRPGLTTIGGKTYIVLGWHEVPKETTHKEVYEHWTQDLPKMEEVPTHIKPFSVMVDSSKGDKQYEVSYGNGAWYCECPGFGFRRSCRHVNEQKAKLSIK